MGENWVIYVLGTIIVLALIGVTTKPRNEEPMTPVQQWQEVYRTCVGSYPTDQHRAACIAAADRVMACAGQKEEK